MAIESGEPSRRYSLALDESWTKPTEGNVAVKDPTRLDPGLRHVVAAVEARDWDQLRRLTGIRQCRRPPGCDKPGSRHDPCKDLHDEQELPLLFEFDWREMTIGVARDRLSKLSLLVAEDYFVDAFGKEEKPRYAGGAIAVSTENPAQLPVLERDEKPRSLRNQIATILNEAEFIVRMELPAGATAFNEGALDDIDLTPATRHCHDTDLDGCGVIVGIIDDGCAFAHPNVLRPGAAGGPPTTRVRYLWDQAHPSAANGWTHVGYGGAELTGTTIDDMIRKVANGAHADKGISREERVYAALDYPIADLASHGTHVMDIAAGNGGALLRHRRASRPRPTSSSSSFPPRRSRMAGALSTSDRRRHRLHLRQGAGKTPAVINISYGGYAGTARRHVARRARASTTSSRSAESRAWSWPPATASKPTATRRRTSPPGRQALAAALDRQARGPDANDLEVWYERQRDARRSRSVAPDGTSRAGRCRYPVTEYRSRRSRRRHRRGRHDQADRRQAVRGEPIAHDPRHAQPDRRAKGTTTTPLAPGTWGDRSCANVGNAR